jgi:aminopeptidase N
MVAAHEVAHQWWYAVVGSDVLAHPWQDEAMATFSAELYKLKAEPAFYQGTLMEYRRRVTSLEAEIGLQPVDQSVAELASKTGAYSTVAYLKGDLFLEALRQKIGEKTFNAGLAHYFQTSSYQIAAPADLLNSFENACSCQLDELYQEWGVSR